MSTAGCGDGNSKRAGSNANSLIAHVTTTGEFDSLVLRADKPVLVKFYATWCGACKQLAPTIDRLAEEYTGRATFVKVDGDRATQLMSEYGIRGYPTVVIFSGGRSGKVLAGVREADEYRAALDAAISSL